MARRAKYWLLKDLVTGRWFGGESDMYENTIRITSYKTEAHAFPTRKSAREIARKYSMLKPIRVD